MIFDRWFQTLLAARPPDAGAELQHRSERQGQAVTVRCPQGPATLPAASVTLYALYGQSGDAPLPLAEADGLVSFAADRLAALVYSRDRGETVILTNGSGCERPARIVATPSDTAGRGLLLLLAHQPVIQPSNEATPHEYIAHSRR